MIDCGSFRSSLSTMTRTAMRLALEVPELANRTDSFPAIRHCRRCNHWQRRPKRGRLKRQQADARLKPVPPGGERRAAIEVR